ncbi:MAG: tetratricopeptide repeat protein [Phycisphaerales bacterium]|nr:tetratricopeptide repeat protein [Phycisphaerales bacterium]
MADLTHAPQLCSGHSDAALKRDITLNVLPARPTQVRKSRMSRWRALSLIAVHLLMIGHILHWWATGRTLSPVEPSEAMYTLNQGHLNAGFVLFALALLATLLLGRFFCGWGCHLVAYQDLCAWLLKKIGIKVKPFRSRVLILAPLALAIYMFVWPTAYRWFVGAPAPTLANHLMTTAFWKTFPGVGVALLTFAVCGFLIVYVLGGKGFCTYACPYGGFFGLVDQAAVGRIRVTDDCEHCGHCTAVCSSNVRVHEEVARFGMVVDPGCMKCMDCVSVCPNDALYFGFTAPPILRALNRTPSASAGPGPESRRTQEPSLALPIELEALNRSSAIDNRQLEIGHRHSPISNLKSEISDSKSQIADSPSSISNLKSDISNPKSEISDPQSPNHQITKSPNRHYDFSFSEELLMIVLGLFSLLAFRGLYGQIPLLLAMGMAAITAFLAMKFLRLLRSPNVKIQNVQLKRGRQITRKGWTFAAVAVAVFAFAAHSSAVQYQHWRGRMLFASADIGDEVWLPGNAWREKASPQQRDTVESAITHIERAEAWGFLSTPAALQDLVWLQLARGDLAAAERIVRRLADLLPDQPEVRRGLAGVLRKTGRFADAESAYRQALCLDPAYSLARRELGALLVEQRRFDDALALCREGDAVPHGDTNWPAELAKTLMTAGRFSQAASQWRTLLAQGGESAPLLAQLGIAELQIAEVELGLAHLRRAVELDPSLTEARYNLAVALLSLRRVPEATALLERVVTDKPAMAEAHYNLAVATFMSARPADALPHIREALRLAPDDLQAREFLALVEKQVSAPSAP